MPRLNNDEQFKFLISCIRYSNNGKVDFTEVAQECNIVSKGAAAKRYERMMKAHGIHQGRESYASMVRPRDSSEPPAPIPRKRKKGQSDSPHDGSPPRQVSSEEVKKESNHNDDTVATVKDEPEAPATSASAGVAQPEYTYYGQVNEAPSSHQSYEGVHGELDFNDFINQAMFGPAGASPAFVAEQGNHEHSTVEMPFRESTSTQPLCSGQLPGEGSAGGDAGVLGR